MRILRGLGLVGLVLVTVGAVWRTATPPAPPRSGTTTVLVRRISPIPAAEAAVAGSWRALVGSPAVVSAEPCVPAEESVTYPAPGVATVDVLCRTAVELGAGRQAAALVWHVRLGWDGHRWLVRSASP